MKGLIGSHGNVPPIDRSHLDSVSQFDQICRVSNASVVPKQCNPVDMRVLIEMVDASGVKRRGATDDAVHFLTFGQEQRRQGGAVLTRNARDEGFHECLMIARSARART